MESKNIVSDETAFRASLESLLQAVVECAFVDYSKALKYGCLCDRSASDVVFAADVKRWIMEDGMVFIGFAGIPQTERARNALKQIYIREVLLNGRHR